jgi:HAMP domain-containing protein
MGIRLKFNLVFLAVAAVGIAAFGLISWPFLIDQAREEVLVRARIMIDGVTAIRHYTAEEIAPLLNPKGSGKFDRQAVASYAAVRNFSMVGEKYPGYDFREASVNPFNPKNRATDAEVDVISELKADPSKKEVITERGTLKGRVLYLSRPLVAEPDCLSCHESPEIAPLPMLALYGRQNGFGWKLNEVIGIEIVSIPMAVPLENAIWTLTRSMIIIAAVFAILAVLMNVLLNSSIIRPVLRMSRLAGEVSMGKSDVEEYVKGGSDELATLSVSLNRMRRSMDEAIKLLDSSKK